MNIEPIQVEGIRVVKLDVRAEPYSPGTKKRLVEKTRLFVHIQDETVMENFVARMAQRAGAPPRLSPRDIKKHVLPAVLKEIAEKFPESRITPDTNFNFSPKAGCTMCPCSPGFVGESNFNYTIFVDVAPGLVTPAS